MKPNRNRLTLSHAQIAQAVQAYREAGSLIVQLPAEKVPPRSPVSPYLGVYEPVGVYDAQVAACEPVMIDMGPLPPVPERRLHPRYEEWSQMGAEFTALFNEAPLLKPAWALKPTWPRTDDDGFAADMAVLGQ